MIITLKGANFKDNKIGVLDNWSITVVRDIGTTYSGPASVVRGASFSATLTLVSSYAYKNGITVTMGSTDITSSAISTNGNKTTISISSVTGHVTINALTIDTSTGGSSSTTVTNILNLSDPDIQWGVTTEAGNTTGEFEADTTRGVSGYISVSAGDKLRGATYRDTVNTDGTYRYPYKSSPVYWYDSSKQFLGATPSNPCFLETSSGSNDFVLTVPTSPAGIAYCRVMLNKTYQNTNLMTKNMPLPDTFVSFGDTSTSNPGDNTGSGTGTTLEGKISAPSSTINVFNPADAVTTVTMKTDATSGESFVAQSERGVSGFISCKPGDVLRGATYRSGGTSADTGTSCYPFKSSPAYFYDSNLNYLSRKETFTGSGDWTMTVPAGASYFRVMINTTYIDTEIITINNPLDFNNFVAYKAST